ncbi:phosphoribosylpyrophosphate synthetase [Lacinutrix salivirga]
MGKYSSLSVAINDLTEKGYTYNFNMKEEFIECAEIQCQLQPDEFNIDEKYRFEEMSDVDNESVLYAISSKDGKIKGLLVNAYGIYADYASFKLVQKLNRPERK